MLTSNIILSVALIALMGVAVLLTIRYSRLSYQLKEREREIARQESELTKRRNALDLFARQVSTSARQSAKTAHVYANKTIDDPNDTAPEAPSRKVYKSLVSQFGYAAGKPFKDRITRRHEGGKTTYSLDLNIYPYEL